MSAALATPARIGGSSSTLTGLLTTARLAWRRNRVFWIAWVLALLTLMPLTVTKYHDLVPPGSHPEQLMATLGSNPTMRAILGVPYDLSTPGGFTMWRVGAFTGWVAGFVALFAIIRGTRADEEEGRTELIRAGVVGRHAILGGALLLTFVATLVLGLLVAATMIGAGTPAAGGLAAGLGLTAMGWVGAGIGAVCAQVFESARAAKAWGAGAVLGGLFLVRAFVDGSMNDNLQWLRWLIPLEWPQLVRPYAGERWWVFVLPLVLTAALVWLAFALMSRRDYAAGLRATQPGPADAAGWLRGARGLAWRLQRAGVISWTVGIVISAIGIGSLGTQMGTMLEQNPQVAQMLEKLGGAGALTNAFYIAMLGILTTVISLAAVQFLGRAHGEENAGHAEVMLSTDTPRTSFLLSHLWIAILVPCLLVVLTGALTPLVQATGDGPASLVGDFVRAALVLLPGMLLVIGIGVALLGWLPRWFALTWAVVGWSMFCSWLAPLFGLPDWLVRLQPWGHLPKLPTDPMTWTPVLVETVIALLLIGIGVLGYRRRDIETR